MDTSKTLRLLAALACATFCPCVLSAQVPDRSAIANWPAPATWSPSASGGGIVAMTDISLAIPFVAVTPCRIADTRGLGFTGQAGPPILDIGTRTFQISGTVTGVPTPCGIPTGADAVSFQFTIVSPNTNGNLIAWPAGGAVPTISVLNWSAGETALGNGTIVPLSAGGALSVRINAAAGSAVGHLVIDVNGYFADDLPAGQYFEITGSRSGPVILAENGSSGEGAEAVRGVITAAVPGGNSVGVRGIIQGTGSFGFGVLGSHAGNGYGTLGESVTGTGIEGRTSTTTGAITTGVSGIIVSSGLLSAAVRGTAFSESGSTWAVQGFNWSNSNDSAGVNGWAGELRSNTSGTVFSKSGVRGDSKDGNGTIGTSEVTGVGGFLMNPANGTILAQGRLGAAFGDPEEPGPPWAVHAVGAIGATGTKAFLEPHPTEPGKVIQYVALEGPEAGTYFRGKARFQRGLATIRVPEDFRMVTDPEGLTVQVTPIGGMASFGVVKMDLDTIVVQGSRDLEFSYLVQGVRASFKEMQPVIRDGTFVPQYPEAKMPPGLAERQKRVLIENGTYKADGTINLETARRLGWDRMWEKRSSPAPEAPVE
jgi:hypothetical protein